MSRVFENCLDRIQACTLSDGLSEIRKAREEFHRLTGEFDEGEPWFELRMNMFLDWYHLDRRDPAGKTPLERFIAHEEQTLDPDERRQFDHLMVTLRSAFRLIRLNDQSILLEDIAGGGRWLAYWTLPTVGLKSGDILDTRLVMIAGRVTTGRGAVLHPREAAEAIEKIVARALTARMPPRQIVDHLDKMRLKLDRYSNVKIRHVYQYPDDAVL